jgi:anti-sigma regulatory factor (Ser/Thr protein kinase)
MAAAQGGPDGAAELVLRLSALDLGALPGAVPSARLHTRAVLTSWGLAGVAESAELVVSELVTNAVAATVAAATGGVPQPVRLRLSARMDGQRVDAVQVEVWDAASALPRPGRDAPPDEPGGWGLVLVEAVAESWGSYPAGAGGKVVWALLTA